MSLKDPPKCAAAAAHARPCSASVSSRRPSRSNRQAAGKRWVSSTIGTAVVRLSVDRCTATEQLGLLHLVECRLVAKVIDMYRKHENTFKSEANEMHLILKVWYR